MKKLFCFTLIIFLCSACTASKELVDYPKLNKVVTKFVDVLKESESFEDINYNSVKEFSFDDGEKGYDVFYETNCSKMTLSYDYDFEFAWMMIKKDDVCNRNNSFSEVVWQEQVNYILSFEEFTINESKFPGSTGNTWDDYKEHMMGKGDNLLITTNDGIIIGYDPSKCLFYIAKDKLLEE